MKLSLALFLTPSIFAAYVTGHPKQSLLEQVNPVHAAGSLTTDVVSSDLLTATVQITNNFPIDAWLIIAHFRGSSDKQQNDSGIFKLSPGQTSGHLNVTYDSERKDFDTWSVGVHFENESLRLWTKTHEASLAIDDENSNSVFETQKWGGSLALSLPKSSALIPFDEPNFNHPAPDLNSFVFFTPVTASDDITNFTVGLTNFDDPEKDIVQSYNFDREPDEGYHFPFYYATGSSQTWTISVDGPHGPLKANFTCNLEPSNHGALILVEMDENGYKFGINLARSRMCTGKWEKDGCT